MPPRIAHKQSNEPYNVTLGILSHRGTQANGKQTVHCINHLDYWKVKIYFNMIDHNVNSRRPCYSQVYVQPQLLIESHIRCEFTANHVGPLQHRPGANVPRLYRERGIHLSVRIGRVAGKTLVVPKALLGADARGGAFCALG